MEGVYKREHLIAEYKYFLALRGNVMLKKECDRHFDKIRSKAAELYKLINSGNTYLQLAKNIEGLSDAPEGETSLDLDDPCPPITKNEILLRKEFLPILNQLANVELPEMGKKPINHYRIRLIRNLYRDFWKKDNAPRGAGFIEFCHKAFLEANDHIERETVESIIKSIPLNHFKK